jgi:hypothetical protein
VTCNGTCALIYRTGSWADLRSDLVKWSIHQDTWFTIEHGLQHFARHSSKDDHSCPQPPFGPSLRANHAVLNNAAASQTSIGRHNFTKGRISKEWSKLRSKSIVPYVATTYERATSRALWNHSYRLWIFRNNEDHKNDNRSVAKYKQKELDTTIEQLYSYFASNTPPINPLQRSHFDIQ